MGLHLNHGSRVAVIGGGPAGSLCATFLLECAQRIKLNLRVDIYEPRDFGRPGPAGCNMCGGIVSESLVRALALEGIHLPPTVVQRGIDSYILHTGTESVRIDTPSHEKGIAALYRGGGPRDLQQVKWGGLDSYLLLVAQERGARVVRSRVTDAGWDGGRPQVRLQGIVQTYDLLVVAIGVNSTGWQFLAKLGLEGRRAQTSRAYITELHLGDKSITRCFGSSMHVFLINIPRLDFAAIIPKGDFLTVCLLGRNIDPALVRAFFAHPAVRTCFPAEWTPAEGLCHCAPSINVREAAPPHADRVVLVGDCGATRLYKDGVGTAYRTAKAAATTAVFSGVSAADFHRHYWPLYRSITADNRFGWLTFAIVQRIKSFSPLLRGVVAMTAGEQAGGAGGAMSTVLWDLFTGSAPYREVFLRTLAPRFVARYIRETVRAIGGRRATREEVSYGEDVFGEELLPEER
jgi:flavin-dependent dehydrogenase